MKEVQNQRTAFGQPGLEPRWTQGNKDGVGTAYAISSRIWFTLSNGILNEVYYPTVDSPQIRNLQYLITDGESFFHEEKHHLHTKTERIAPQVLGYRITNSDPEGRYTITKEIITDSRDSCILQHTRLTGNTQMLAMLRLYVLCAPQLGIGGWNDSAKVVDVAGVKILTAHQDGNWLAMAATVPFTRTSCGYLGKSDGWTDLADNFQMDWEFHQAQGGNIALTAEIDPSNSQDFTLGLAFGNRQHDAVTTVLLSLDIPFEQKRGYTLRILALAPFQLRWSTDDWQMVNDTNSTATAIEIEFVDIPIAPNQQSPIHFTFFWTVPNHWENHNYQITIVG